MKPETNKPRAGACLTQPVRRHAWEYYTVGGYTGGTKCKRCKVCGWYGRVSALRKYGVPTCSPSNASAEVSRYAAWRCEHYSSALHFGAEAPPGEWVCADCGDTSDDAGRYRKAEAYEAQDEDGECYECSTCGCQMAMPPPPHNATSAGAIGENPTE